MYQTKLLFLLPIVAITLEMVELMLVAMEPLMKMLIIQMIKRIVIENL